MFGFNPNPDLDTVCQRSCYPLRYPFYIVSYHMKWVTTSWTYSSFYLRFFFELKGCFPRTGSGFGFFWKNVYLVLFPRNPSVIKWRSSIRHCVKYIHNCLHMKCKSIDSAWILFREAAKKRYSLSGPATKALRLTPPPSSSVATFFCDFFCRASKKFFFS